MIAIVNVGPHDDPNPLGERNYELRINSDVIATFKHKRGDGLAKCLMLAAAAEERRKWEFAAKIVARQPLPNKTIAKLQERIKELASENEAWKREAKRWRDMYIEYDEMLEKDLEKAKTRIANVTSKIKSLEKEINDEKY